MDILGVKPETWFPVVTLVLGAGLKAISDLLQARRQSAAAKEARAEARSDTLAIRSAEFQREALLELQAGIQILARATGRALHQDRMAATKGVKWGHASLGSETDGASLDGQTRIVKYRVRIHDDHIRELSDMFSAACAMCVIARDEVTAKQEMARSMDLFKQVNEAIGLALRIEAALVKG